ncbi:MAG: ferrous iron transporter B [Zetaproteobacteria bacterium]|nr:MAG: ferrous iron transporter B [Zetaproteobacteria bacterium]
MSASASKAQLIGPLFRGTSRLRIALVGRPDSGKSTIFHAVASTSIDQGYLAHTDKAYRRCIVQIGMDEVELVDLPSVSGLCNLRGDDLEGLKYLLWGDSRPRVSAHESAAPPAPFSRPDLLIHVVDASQLVHHLQLTLELIELGLPIVLGLNMVDKARRKGMIIDAEGLQRALGIPVVPMIAIKGFGVAKLFARAVQAVREGSCPLPQPAGPRVAEWGQRLRALVDTDAVREAFRVPLPFMIRQLKQRDTYFDAELASHFPEHARKLEALRRQAMDSLGRPLADVVAEDYRRRASALCEQVVRLTHRSQTTTWEDRLDAVFLHPRWGLLGSMLLFAGVLFMVFEVSAGIDALTSARLTELVAQWQPQGLAGVIGRAVVDGVVGLIGIVVPYMLPLVLMLVLLEESGVMQRVAFVVDRFFHYIGLHGKVAVPFLLGLGCNVPAIAATRHVASGRDRIVASLLITFVPCSARSAVLLALGGKYLGGLGVFAVFMLSMLLIALLGKVLVRRYPNISPGMIQEIPPYALPRMGSVLRATWQRTQDILTIVLPLLVGGSVVLAVLQYVGAEQWLNEALAPITVWLLGLPAALGVPILFGVLRKELSLLMVYQALGTFEIDQLLDWTQISTFLVFLMLYVPCISTFAVMLKVIGRRDAWFSVMLSMGVAMVCALLVRLLLQGVQLLVQA